MSRRLLITDVDNTLFSWVDHYAAGLQSLTDTLSAELDLPPDQVLRALREVFVRHGSVEVPQPTDHLRILNDADPQVRETVSDRAEDAFRRALTASMRHYPQVQATLRYLRQQGVVIVAVTNSGGLQAVRRLRRMQLSRLLDGLVAWDHHSQDAREPARYDKEFAQDLARAGISWGRLLPREQLKPSLAAYELVLDRFDVQPEHAWVVGDSLNKDLDPAVKLGAVPVWASYGHCFEANNFDLLSQVTHWSERRIAHAYDTLSVKPQHVISSFAELPALMADQRPLFFAPAQRCPTYHRRRWQASAASCPQRPLPIRPS